MRLVVRPRARHATGWVARYIAALLARKPEAVLAVPTGRTAVDVYAALVALHRAGRADFSAATIFNLDEFFGVGRDDPRSFASFLRRHFLDHVNVSPGRMHLLDGATRDWPTAVRRYERAIAAAGGLDVAILGIGRNGHIAFNEPAAALAGRTQRVRLTTATRRAYARLLAPGAVVPAHALTMGIATILQAKDVVLVATGAAKASIVARALAGPITPRVPASFIQTHPAAVVVLDRAAATGL